MSLSTAESLDAISRHSEGLAAAARDNLAAPVEHCPDWKVADLVRHMTEVHWFWRTVAADLPSEPPDADRCPPRAADEDLVDAFLVGATELVDTLRAADPSAACWTWATQKDVAFITRHQVQEAAGHHWDGAHAAGEPTRPDFFAEDVAADSVDEFLQFSVSVEEDPAPDRASLGGAFWFRTPRQEWYVTDGQTPGSSSVSAASASPTDPRRHTNRGLEATIRMTQASAQSGKTNVATAMMPTTTIRPRSTFGGSRRPTVAPIWPPTTEPTAIRPATAQLTPPAAPFGT